MTNHRLKNNSTILFLGESYHELADTSVQKKHQLKIVSDFTALQRALAEEPSILIIRTNKDSGNYAHVIEKILLNEYKPILIYVSDTINHLSTASLKNIKLTLPYSTCFEDLISEIDQLKFKNSYDEDFVNSELDLRTDNNSDSLSLILIGIAIVTTLILGAFYFLE